MSGGPDAGNIIAGIILILFGLFITLLGGGCTFLFLSELSAIFQGDGIALFTLSLFTLGTGLALIYVGFRLLIRRSR